MGQLLSEPSKDKQTITGEGKSVIFAGSQMQGWRNTMEDANIIKVDIQEDISLFGVFDGHRGQVAKFLGQHFLEELLKNYNFIHRDFSKALEETFIKMDDLMLADQGQDKIAQKSQHVGCSASVSLIVGKDIYVANAGHSRAILYRNNENVDLSVDHTANNQNEKARISLAGYPNLEGKADLFGEYFITRALGHFYQKSDNTKGKLEQLVIAVPEITKTEIIGGDKFLLMGTHKLYLTQRQQRKQITKQILGETIELLLDRLLAPDQKQPGINNMTAILIFFKK